jgi:hypothetical protein
MIIHVLDWKNKTEKEEILIRAAIYAKDLILKKIPNSEVKAIYLTGSLARRETNEKSDVDILTILINPIHAQIIDELNGSVGNQHIPKIGFSALTTDELTANKSFTPGAAAPDRFLKRLSTSILLHGEHINPNDYPTRTDYDELDGLIKNIRERMIPMMQNKKMGFQDFIKNALWLGEAEYRISNKKSMGSWKEMAESLTNKEHIIYDALAYRNNNTQDETKRQEFINKLEKYIDYLEAKYIQN